MQDFRYLIESEARTLSRLHSRVNETFVERSGNRSAWEAACQAFHSYQSAIDPYLEKTNQATAYLDKEFLEFAIIYVEANPFFFRSGYIKEEILHQLKNAPLTPKQKERLLAVALNAAKTCGHREYRRHCRLACKLADANLIKDLNQMAESTNAKQASRAKLMLKYINKHNEKT